MPDGATHDRITLIAIPSVGFVAFLITAPILAFFAMQGMSLGSVLLSPDLDHDSGSDAYRIWGWPLRYIWAPYARFIPHRSFLSHCPVIGTVLRVFYLLSWIVLAVALAAVAAAQIGWIESTLAGLDAALRFVAPYWREGSAFLLGVEAAAEAHIVADRWW